MPYRYSNTTCRTVTATPHEVPLQQHHMPYRYNNTTCCTVPCMTFIALFGNVIRVNRAIIKLSLLPAAYKFLPNFFLHNLTPYIEKIIGISVRISMYGSRRITYCVLVRLWRENCKGWGSADLKNSLISESVWKRNGTIMVGRIVIKCNLY
jgi:hypothetical protein